MNAFSACQTALPVVPNELLDIIFKFDGSQSLQETQEEFMIKNVRMHTGWNREGCVLTGYSISPTDVCVAMVCESLRRPLINVLSESQILALHILLLIF